MNSDGSSQISLTNFVPAPGPDRYVDGYSWSPDSQKLVFAANGEIYVIRPDGTEQTNLTSSSDLNASRPTWSPDGGRILFSALIEGAPDLFVMNVDGSGLRNLTNHPAADEGGAWQP
jgi:TolB protein